MTDIILNLELFKHDLKELDYNEHYFWEYRGVTLVIWRHSQGYLCGYVEITDKADIDLNRLYGNTRFYSVELDWLDEKFNGKEFVGFACNNGDDWTPIDYKLEDLVYRDTCFVTYVLLSCLRFR